MTNLIDQLKAMRPNGDDKPAPEPKKTKKKEYHCEKCDKSFHSLSVFNAHMKLKHEAEEAKPKGGKKDDKVWDYDRIVRHTEKATLFEHKDYRFWLPKSKYTLGMRADDTICTASVPSWMTVRTIKFKN